MGKRVAQKEVVDYEETFAHTTKWDTMWTTFAFITQIGCKVHQMDVKTTFLNGDFKANVFTSQPKGFVVKGKEENLCKLTKCLYCLKQAPQDYYDKLNGHLLKLNFKHFNLDGAFVFVKKVANIVVYLVVYVDFW